MGKPELRQKMKSIISSISDIESRSSAILEHTLLKKLISDSSKVLLFHPMNGEPQIDQMIVGCFSDKDFCFPSPDPSDLLEQGVDLALVPGLAFTAQGLRLGRGGGYFDRFLKSFTGTSVGVCFQEQVLEEIPVEPHDQSVDALLIL